MWSVTVYLKSGNRITTYLRGGTKIRRPYPSSVGAGLVFQTTHGALVVTADAVEATEYEWEEAQG